MRLLVLLLVGCAEPVEPSVTLGTGTAAFVPLADDDPLPLVYGIQGGWHVDVALRTTGLDADATVLSYDATLDGVPVAFPATLELADALVLPTDDGWIRLGDRIVFDVISDAAVLDTTLVIGVDVTSDDLALRDERTVRVVAPPG